MQTVYLGNDGWVVETMKSRGWTVVEEHKPGVTCAVLDFRDEQHADALFSWVENHREDHAQLALVPDDAPGLASRLTRLGVRVLPDAYVSPRDSNAAHLLVGTVQQCCVARSNVPLDVERQVFELLGLHALAQAVSTSLNPDTVARRALDVLIGLIPDSSIAIYIANPRPTLSGELAPVKSGTRDWVLIGVRDGNVCFPDVLAHDLLAGCLETTDAAWLDPEDELAGLICAGDPAQQAAILPIHGTTGPIAALAICHRRARQELSLRRDVLVSVGAQLGTALENAWLFEEIGVAYRSLQSTQEQLVLAEKFAAVGLLAAEVAHEINNPAAFIITNLSVMEEYVVTIADFHRELRRRLEAHGAIERDAFFELLAEHEIEFLDEDLPNLVRRSLVGLERIHQIVMDLRFFSREDGGNSTRVNLESLLESVVSLVGHEARYKAVIVLDLESLPPITSDANRLSQVFLNLLLNSVQAIEAGDGEPHEIRVTGRRKESQVELVFSDDGPGIPEENRELVFRPFFTTKEPGSGTGLGLSISRDILHSLGGEVTLTDGPGARFVVTLPVESPEDE